MSESVKQRKARAEALRNRVPTKAEIRKLMDQINKHSDILPSDFFYEGKWHRMAEA
jgi:hypothetical protein